MWLESAIAPNTHQRFKTSGTSEKKSRNTMESVDVGNWKMEKDGGTAGAGRWRKSHCLDPLGRI